MGKKLNTAAVLSELSEGSAFFPSYKGNDNSPSLPSTTQEQVSPEERTSPPSTPRTPVLPVRDVPPTKRVMKQRHPFDIYHDQYESLQRLALEERKQGGVGSMSAMVREAIDNLIAQRAKNNKD